MSNNREQHIGLVNNNIHSMSLDLTRFVLEISPARMVIILLLLSSRLEYIRRTNEELVITIFHMN